MRRLATRREVSFAVALDALGRRLAGLPAERFRHHRALRALLEQLARERPVALLLDDLHWADAASLEFVLHLLRRPPSAAHLLVLACGASIPCSGCSTPRGWGPGSRSSRWRRWARGRAGAARGHRRPAAANAPCAKRAGTRCSSASWRAATASSCRVRSSPRLRSSSEGSTPGAHLIDGAAVAGDPFDPEIAAAAAGLCPTRCRARPPGGGRRRAAAGRGAFAFRHPLVRRAVYDDTPASWRLAAHERAAAALEQRGAGPVTRAYHVARSARPGDDAAIALLRAAAEATAASPAAAARWYEAALDWCAMTSRAARTAGAAAPRLALSGG